MELLRRLDLNLSQFVESATDVTSYYYFSSSNFDDDDSPRVSLKQTSASLINVTERQSKRRSRSETGWRQTDLLAAYM